ncbi:hypothetical protein [Streptomyces sp. SudanB52_2052]|uniref:hypothetical protein n=1 Tax=Streptomyces sp. SudanB52_2052 TaxID=3035276 RepID=UPI003F55DE6B
MSNSGAQSPTGEAEKKSRLNAEHLYRLATLVIGMTGVAGFAVFVILSMLYEEFYENFGILPSEVGLDYSQTLFRSWGFILLAAGALTFTAFLVWATTLLVRRYLRKRRDKEERKSNDDAVATERRREQRFTRLLKLYAIAMPVAIALEIFIIGGPLAASAIDDRIEQRRKGGEAGGRVDPIRVSHLLIMDIAAYEVESITRSVDGKPISSLNGKKLLLLGTNDGIYILYDTATGAIVKLSAGGSVLRLKAHENDNGD